MPCNRSSHWSLVMVIPSASTIMLFDSMGNTTDLGLCSISQGGIFHGKAHKFFDGISGSFHTNMSDSIKLKTIIIIN